jgi:hypothetical protein
LEADAQSASRARASSSALDSRLLRAMRECKGLKHQKSRSHYFALRPRRIPSVAMYQKTFGATRRNATDPARCTKSASCLALLRFFMKHNVMRDIKGHLYEREQLSRKRHALSALRKLANTPKRGLK